MSVSFMHSGRSSTSQGSVNCAGLQ